MILNKHGENFEYDGKVYTIGDTIACNDMSCYRGVFGTITEIRTNDDKETDNDGPDIYCDLTAPVLRIDVEAVEKNFQKPIRELNLNGVIFDPSMIDVINTDGNSAKIFIVREKHYVSGDKYEHKRYFRDYNNAKFYLNKTLLKEMKECGDISDIKSKFKGVYEEEDKDFYYVGEDGGALENSYLIELKTATIS